MYQALYRKYRPKSFDDVVGQKYIISALKNSIINDKINHAYMFFGPRGIGKTTVAKIFSRAVNCENPIDGNPCNKCSSCLYSSDKECVDIIEIDAASNNGVDEIREIKNKVNFVPSELKYKIYIIDEVHMLTSGAFNALLKTLEEPPKHVIFVLATTDPQKVSDTIISRCQCYSFKRISNLSNVERLKIVVEKENIDIDDSVLNEIAVYSDGGLRDSLGMLDKLYSYKNGKIKLDDFYMLNDMISKNELENFINILINKNVEEFLVILRKFNDSGKNIVEIINQVLFLLRDYIVRHYLNEKIVDNVDNYIELINLINEKMFDIKKSSMPYIFVEIFLLNYMYESDRNISQEIFSVKPKETDAKKEVIEKKQISVDIKSEIDNNYLNDISNLMKIRVNNTLAKASKKQKRIDAEKMEKLNDYVFNQKVGYIASEILNGNLCASSEDNIIISYEYESIVNQNLLNLNKINDVYNDLTNSNKKLAFITKEQWEICKNEYIRFTKSGKKYKIEVEPNITSINPVEKKDLEEKSVFDTFGDIVEFR